MALWRHISRGNTVQHHVISDFSILLPLYAIIYNFHSYLLLYASHKSLGLNSMHKIICPWNGEICVFEWRLNENNIAESFLNNLGNWTVQKKEKGNDYYNVNESYCYYIYWGKKKNQNPHQTQFDVVTSVEQVSTMIGSR